MMSIYHVLPQQHNTTQHNTTQHNLMPNPFLTNAPSHHNSHKKERSQDRHNPFMTAKSNLQSQSQSQSHNHLEPQVQTPPPSFDESFPSLSQHPRPQPKSPKLNFKSAVQQGQPSSQIQPSSQNQFLRPMNQFLRPMNHFLHPVNRIRYEHDCNEDYGDNGDAYDSAYTKYYDD